MNQSPRNRFAARAIFIMLMTAFGLGLNYFFGIFVARKLGAESFGLYSLGMAIFGILSISAVMGLDNAMLRFSSTGKNNNVSLNKLNVIIIIIGLFSGLVIATALYLFSPFISTAYFNKPQLENVLKILSIGVPAFVLLTLFLSVLQSNHDVKIRATIKYLYEPVSKFIFFVLLACIGLELIGVVISVVMAIWLCAIIASGFVLKDIFFRNENLEFTYLVDVLKYSYPIAITVAITIAASKTDMIVIGSNLSQLDLALYAAAFQTSAILVIVLQSLESVVAPIFSEQLSTPCDIEELHKDYVTANRWAMLLGVPLSLIFILESESILSLYGEEFTSVGDVFKVLVAAQLANIVSGSASVILLMGGHSKVSLFNGMVSAIILIALNFYLIPGYGLFGAAYAVFKCDTCNQCIKNY